MATVNFLYRSIKENAPLNIRLLFRHDKMDYSLGAKTKLFVYTIEELNANDKVSNKRFWKERFKKSKDIGFQNKQAEINFELNRITNHVLDTFNKANINSVIEDSKWLYNCLESYYNPNKDIEIPTDLLSFIDYYIQKKGKGGNTASVKKYRVIKNKLKRFEDYRKKQILIADIDEDFKDGFEKYYIDQQYSRNTIHREFVFVKTFCFHARYLGLKTHHHLDSLKFDREEVKHIYLSFDEIKKIKEVELPHEYLENARDWLLISCYLGQRISDFMNFSSTLIRNENDKYLLEFRQVKTKKLMTIPVSKEVREILSKRDGEFPRAISDQKYNDYIKEVARIAGLNEICEGKKRINVTPDKKKGSFRDVIGKYEKWELITSHIGRRSFATNYYGKVPTTYLINITGHSTESMFLNYIKKSNKDIALDAYKYFN
ncbi:site-specific integrase [Aquimarina macrocephali]|uniref:site-specific integrase n=1 Tax=Aquimarina macrocephali TaxID=666563 RepID=UPI000466058E|nr:site-specific integrase [Aquimarina macrocephali]